MIGIACVGIAFALLAALAAGVCGIIDDKRNPDKGNKDPE